MIKILIVLFLFFLVFSSFFRCAITNLHNVGIYSVYDIYQYFYCKKWTEFNCYGIKLYVGMFGHGKTLSMTHEARLLYKRYGDSLRFVSNYKLIGIPYIPLVNFNQLLEIGEQEDSQYVGTVVLIDEIQSVLSHRNYASFPLELLNVLTQQRKKKCYILCSAQRFFMVDKIWRSITTYVVDCNKYWRFQNMRVYDAWDYENAMTPTLVRALSSKWWFVKNADFDSYDTEQMISRNMSADFISNDEKLARLGLDNVVNEQAIRKPSKLLKKQRKLKK